MNVFIDAIGLAHLPVQTPPRIVSLTPSITELLFTLGLENYIVGRTHYCVHPQPVVQMLPSVGGTKELHYSRFLALQPTHVVVNIDENPRALAERIAQDGIEVIVTHPLLPEDNVDLYRLLGGIFQRTAQAEQLVAAFNAALAELRGELWPPRRVLYLIWRKPWMSVSSATYIAAMLALVGWEVLPAHSVERYPKLELERSLLDAAELILFSSEPYTFRAKDVQDFSRDYQVPAHKLHLIDGEMTAWYGSRAIAALGYLRQFARSIKEPLNN